MYDMPHLGGQDGLTLLVWAHPSLHPVCAFILPRYLGGRGRTLLISRGSLNMLAQEAKLGLALGNLTSCDVTGALCGAVRALGGEGRQAGPQRCVL